MKTGQIMAVFFLIVEYIYIFSTFSERTFQKFIFVVVLGLCGLLCLIVQDIADKKDTQLNKDKKELRRIEKEAENAVKQIIHGKTIKEKRK